MPGRDRHRDAHDPETLSLVPSSDVPPSSLSSRLRPGSASGVVVTANEVTSQSTSGPAALARCSSDSMRRRSRLPRPTDSAISRRAFDNHRRRRAPRATSRPVVREIHPTPSSGADRGGPGCRRRQHQRNPARQVSGVLVPVISPEHTTARYDQQGCRRPPDWPSAAGPAWPPRVSRTSNPRSVSAATTGGHQRDPRADHTPSTPEGRRRSRATGLRRLEC